MRKAAVLREIPIRVLHPLRLPVSWACQHGWLPFEAKRYFPWRWVLEPFTIYGPGWSCRWFPTEFDSIAHVMFWSGLRKWEKETASVVLEQIRLSRCFIDIGANCGIYTVFACAENPDVRVLAIEPVAKICAALKQNVINNGYASRVTVLNVALGSFNGLTAFHEAEDCTMGSLGTVGYYGQRGSVIEVECRTLDSLVGQLQIEPDFLKIDVEGAEDVVLEGAQSVISRFRPRIVLEANPADPTERMTELLARHGYNFLILTDRGPQPRDAIVPEEPYHNWLCLPKY